MKSCKTVLAASIALVLGTIGTAQAHTSFVVDATSVPYANGTYSATIRGGHGCEDEVTKEEFDTERMEVTIPAGVTAVKPYDAPWGKATVEKDTAGNVTKLIWTKTGGPLPADTHLYNVTFRARLPNAPLTSITFDTVHFCHNALNEEITHAWTAANGGPTLNLMPTRAPGWNKYQINQAIADVAALKKFFGDAYIVWSGGAAYSSNPVTDNLITNKLITIPANQEFWVKY